MTREHEATRRKSFARRQHDLGERRATVRDPLLPDFSADNLARNHDLEHRIDALPIVDVVRVLVIAAHSLWHRAPKRATHDALVAELHAGIDEIHRAGLS